MTLQEGIKLFRTHQKSQAREKTRESYAYLLRNLETLFGETTVEAISAEDIHEFLLIVTDGRARSSARLRYAQVKAFFNFLIESTVRADDHSHKAHTRISTHSQVELYRQMRPEFNRIWG